MIKKEKGDVNYSRGMIHSHCGKVFSNDKDYCQHFRGHTGAITQGTCTEVEGPINPIYWCELFLKVKR